MAKAKPKRKGGRPRGATDRRPRKKSPAVTDFAERYGAHVPETGQTVFAAKSLESLNAIVASLRDPDSWDVPEPVGPDGKGRAIAILPDSRNPEPWNYSTAEWVFDWLDKAGSAKKELGISFPPFAVLAPPAHVIQLHQPQQMELEELARGLLEFGKYILQALGEDGIQGFILEPKTFKKRNVWSKEALQGVAEMVTPPKPQEGRRAFRKTALSLRLKEFKATRSRNDADPFLMESEIEILFRELVQEHTGKSLKQLEILERTSLELLRRYAHEFEKAETTERIKIKF